MSVFMTLKVQGDPAKLLAIAKDQPELFPSVSARGREHGALHHQFLVSGDTILVLDEWVDAESFQKFFAASPEIQQIMADAGVTTAPEITFWERLDVGDEF
jgi:quinol monooxygenase YgiN